MLIGHSQGGMLAIKVLQDLAGASGDRIAVWNPLADAPEGRFAVVDPLTGAERPVVGLRVPYASGARDRKPDARAARPVGHGAAAAQRPGHGRASSPGSSSSGIRSRARSRARRESDPYRPTGSAVVRNVTLPADYGHISLPLAAHLAANPVTRAWIDALLAARRARCAAGRRRSRHAQHPARRRHLVQREEALVPGGAAADPRAAAPRRDRPLRATGALACRAG